MLDSTVTIPFSRLEELLDIETRANLLADFTKNTKHFVSREDVAHYLNFELPKNEDNINAGND